MAGHGTTEYEGSQILTRIVANANCSNLFYSMERICFLLFISRWQEERKIELGI